MDSQWNQRMESTGDGRVAPVGRLASSPTCSEVSWVMQRLWSCFAHLSTGIASGV